MAKMYQINSGKRMGNRAAGWMIDLNLAPASYYLLTVPGRKSGKPHTTPVILVEQSGVRWLVAPYGDVNWVLNARAAGKVTLSRRRKAQVFHIEEVGPETAAPVLKAYLQSVRVVRSYFDCQPDAPLQDFIAESSRHPVFRLVPVTQG